MGTATRPLSLSLSQVPAQASLLPSMLLLCYSTLPQAQSQPGLSWAWTETSETERQNKHFLPLRCLPQEFCHSDEKLTNKVTPDFKRDFGVTCVNTTQPSNQESQFKEIKPFSFTSGTSLIATSSGQMKISTYHHPPQILDLTENGAHEAPPPHTYLSSPEVRGAVLPLTDSENIWDITSLGSFEQKGQNLFWAKHCSAAMKKMRGKISLEFPSQS